VIYTAPKSQQRIRVTLCDPIWQVYQLICKWLHHKDTDCFLQS